MKKFVKDFLWLMMIFASIGIFIWGGVIAFVVIVVCPYLIYCLFFWKGGLIKRWRRRR